jgi:hypothetical protein
MDEQEQRFFISFLAKQMKTYYREILAHRVFVRILKEAGYGDVEAIIETARSSPQVQAQIDRNFAGLDELLPPYDEADPQGVFREFLEKWKPDGEPN